MTMAKLREAIEHLDPNTPVLLAVQPAWPMHYDVAAMPRLVEGALYLAANEQLGYLPHDVANELGW